ncbi:hypothetical protein NCLIV_002670 [Neospora caninum Liverpool]|uniref:Nrap protein n=1 Tax=Neospora caninum (strain Liverpool) TaxID=572307 RepID=F0V7T8_NEOCL|nr:hypothetical protein NCLIV_002670 [Neospora caninum Liverpool]CBZ49779.1 hypothetical protein NCLIV_002670 [Neospora caninum Liverpool]|eukprot:XP_003879814.1 hypothetical protein NCLIV_002670 [Neospora caninum Liverpool]
MGGRGREDGRGADDGARPSRPRAASAVSLDSLDLNASGALSGPSVHAALPGRTLQAARHVEKKRKHLIEEREAEQFLGSAAASRQDATQHPSLFLQKARFFRSSLFRMQLDKLAKAARGSMPARLAAAAGHGAPRLTSAEGKAEGNDEGSDADPTEPKGEKQRKKQSQKSVEARRRREDESEETQAVAAFLVYLRHMLSEAPTNEVSFENKKGRNGSRPLTPLLVPVSSSSPSAFSPVSGEIVGFRFEPPVAVKVVGSFPLGLMSSFDKNVDVAVEMPAHMFQTKDYLNYRYLAKRSAYLEQLYVHLRASLAAHFPSPCSSHKSDACPEAARRFRQLAPFCLPRVAVQLWQGDSAKPILIIAFAPTSSLASRDKNAAQTQRLQSCSRTDLSAWTVRLLFTPPSASPLFKEHLLAPARNCVRSPTWCLADEGPSSSPAAETDGLLPPTPYYNGLVLEDLRMHARQKRLHQCCQAFGEAFRDAVQLLKVWAHRRGRNLFVISSSLKANADKRGERDALATSQTAVPATGLDGSTLAMLCGHVCTSSRDVALSATAHDIFVLTLSFLAKADFLGYYYVFGSSQAYPRECLQQPSTPDVMGGLSRVSSSSASSTTKDEALCGRLTLCPGVVAEALLFDGEDCVHNLLWRMQLHVAELQQLARSSLRAMEALKDPFDALFGAVGIAGLAQREWTTEEGPQGDDAETAKGSHARRDADALQVGLLLENDLQVNIPHIPSPSQIRAALRPEASVPLHDYFSYRERPDKSAEETHAGAATQASAEKSKTAVSERDFLRSLDEGPKWETPSLRLLAASLLRVLLRALGDRVQSIQIRFTYPTFNALRTAATRKEGTAHSAVDADAHEKAVFGNMPFTWQDGFQDAMLENKVTPGLLLSLRLNGASATRTLDRGPPAAVGGGVDEAVESFKAFWGPAKVELRRFQDAQILNTVLWRGDSVKCSAGAALLNPNDASASPFFSRSGCIAAEGAGHAPPHVEIINYALRRHFPSLLLLQAEGAEPADRKTPQEPTANDEQRRSGDTARSLVSCWLQSSPLDMAGGARAKDREMHKALLQAFSELKNTICSLSAVPLTVKQARSTSPALRYFDLPVTFSPVFASREADEEHDMRTLHPVVLEFESSSGWPEDPVAIRKIKTAFLLAMQSELLADYGINGTVTEDFLDVEMTSFLFRITIFHPAEVIAAGAVYAEPTSEPLARHLKGLPERLVALASHSASSLRDEDSSVGTLSVSPDSPSGEKAGDKEKITDILSFLAADDEDGATARKSGLDCIGLALLSGKESDSKRLMKQEMQRLQHLRHLWWEPQIAGVLQACAMRFPAFGGSVWLIWRWLGEMQLPGLFRVVEHLAVTLFVDHQRQGFAAPPQSPQVAFLSFRLYPTIHTVFDPHGFLIPSPEAATFDRFVQNARSALLKLSGTLSRPSATSAVWREVFTPDLRSFDIVLSLVDPLRARPGAASKTAAHKRYANVESFHSTDNAMSLCGLQMAASKRRYLFLRFLGQLREAYSDALILAYNPMAASLTAGGMPAFIAVKVRPGALAMRRADPAVLLPFCGIQTVPDLDAGTALQAETNTASSDDENQEREDGQGSMKYKKQTESCSFELTVNPVLLVSSLMSMGHGLVESVHILS